ncbi:MAG: DNA repair protein RecN [Actinobacteria bacterium HGW-Actinobacteria-4]|nr:MAG: DNA repair protein RecN [Actinobacteria bacterium HGW-Actinobacteria-4]
MLHELSIENLGVIESARVSFDRGLTVVTGETGAGKTMVLTGLGLILGGKSTPAAVRVGADEASVEAVLDVPVDAHATTVLADAGVMVEDDGSVVVARTVGATTRSRTIVGGRTVPQALLAQVADQLVTVHGQSDQVRLRSPARQRDTLDAYAGANHALVVANYREAWGAWGEARAALEAMEAGAESQRSEMVRLRDDLAAIDDVDPQPGEDAALAAEAQVLENSEAVRMGVAGAQIALNSDADASVVAAVEAARRSLADAAHHDRSLAPLEERLAEISYAASDVASELASYLDNISADAARLDEVHRRRSDIATLLRRLGMDLPSALDFRARAREKVAEDDAWDERLHARREAESRSHSEVLELARQVSAGRREAATKLASAVNNELAQLAMADARFAISVDDTDVGPSGADVVTMNLSAHPGAPPRPVAEAASGGELSRIMLAVEVSLAHAGTAPGHTFVFDEVDAGVGGKAAVAVGNRLAELARTHQVLVVTHLAQVAAFADHHVVVAKATDGAVTRAHVHEVAGEDRVQEIARLLSGQEDSTTARAHALELLEASSVAR